MSTDNSSSGVPSDLELPFALARESGRTHLQVGIPNISFFYYYLKFPLLFIMYGHKQKTMAIILLLL